MLRPRFYHGLRIVESRKVSRLKVNPVDESGLKASSDEVTPPSRPSFSVRTLFLFSVTLVAVDKRGDTSSPWSRKAMQVFQIYRHRVTLLEV
jgi:hypothetical protein